MLATIGSVTTATRFARIIEKNTGGRAAVVSTPAAINKGGCAYSVRFDDRYEQAVRRLAVENAIEVKKYYTETAGRRGRVYNAVP